MSNLCRVCMCTNVKYGSVLHECSDGRRLSEQIMAICNVTISDKDGLPNVICPDCLHELRSALTFKLKCEKTDKILRKSNTFNTPKRKNITNFYEDAKIEFKTNVRDVEVHHDNGISELDVDTDSKPEQCLALTTENKYSITKLKHKCEQCGINVRTKQELKLHFKQHGFICDRCKRQFKTKYAMENHFRHKNRDCQLISYDKSVIVGGVGKNRVFYCTQCNYKTNRLIHMRPHLITHTGLRPFACDLCPCAYTQLGPLKYHKQLVHENKDLSVTCDVCGKTLPSKRHLYKHSIVHLDAKYSCDICHVRLKSRSTLAEHMTRHIGVKNFTCEICASAFFTPTELYNHKRIHKAIENRRAFPCPQCEYRATKKYCLQKHVSRHSDDRPFSCRHCGQLYESAHLLDKHSRIHDKIFKCPICESMHSKILYLKRHMSKHHKVNVASKDLNVDVQLFKDLQGGNVLSSQDVRL